MRRGMPAPVQTMPTRMGRCGVVFPACPSTRAGCKGWQASLCDRTTMPWGRSYSKAQKLCWHHRAGRGDKRDCCCTL